MSNGKYKVEYSAGAGSGSVEDPKLYAEGSHADVQYASAIKAPKGKVFLYWQSETGDAYYPDDKIAVNSTNAGDDKIITLTAVYGNKADTASLTYNSNYPEGSIDTDGNQKVTQKYNGGTDLTNNTKLKTLTLEETGFTAPLGYEFTGWNTKPDGSGKSIAADADPATEILVDNSGDNILYAQWTEKPKTEITVKPVDKSKTYDGTALKADSYEITGGSLGEGDRIVATYGGSQTNAGSSDSSFASFKIMHGNVDVTDLLYKVTKETGTLRVDPKEVTVTAEDKSKAYGEKDPELTAKVAGALNDDKIQYSLSREAGEDVGTYAITPSGDEDQGNYTVKFVDGKLTISKSDKLTVTATGYEGVYDGESHAASAVANVTEGTTIFYKVGVDGEWTTEAPSIKDAGTKTVYVKAENSNYKTAKADAVTLKVTKRPVTLTSETASKEYDGAPLTRPDVAVGGQGFVAGEVSDIKATGSQTAAGTSDNTISYTKEEGFKDSNYDITEVTGKLTVTKNASREIVLTAASGSKTYDGTPLKAGDATITGLPDGFTGEAVSGGETRTNAGVTVTKVKSYKIYNAEGKDVTDQFTNVKYVDGKLTVNKRSVTLTSESATKVFDGTALTRPDVTGQEGFVSGEVTDVKATGSITKAGTVVNAITYTAGKNFDEGNYDITKKEGKLTVTKVPASQAEVKVTAKSNSWVYDGKSHSDDGYTVSGLDKMPEGFSVKATVEGSVKNVKDSGAANRITKAAIMYKGEDVTDQFESGVAIKNGVLNITKKPVVIRSASDSKVYDGKPLTNSKVYFQDGKTFVDGEVKAEAVGSITKVGSTKNTIKLTVADGYTLDNYLITEDPGTLTVTKNNEAVTVTARSATKPYDGTELTAGYDWTAPAGYTVEAKTSGSITDVGKVANKIDSYVVRDADGNDVTDQFGNIRTADGTLEVTKRQVTLSSGSASKEYDGTALTNGEVSGGDQFVAGEVSNVRATGSITKVGKVKNTIEYDTNDGFKAGNYKITEEPGTLEITANTTAAIKVTAPSDTKMYDGKTLKAGKAVVTGLPDGFTGIADSTGSIKNAGTATTTVDKNSLVIRDADGNDVTDQFANITYKDGQLTVTKRTVTLKSESATKVFDGTALTRPEVTVGGQGFVDGEVKDIKATGSITKAGSVTNTITYTENSAFDKDNYDITKDEGTLTIKKVPSEKADVAVTANSNTWVYDGKSHSDDGYTASGLDKMPSGFSVKATVVGSVKNVNDSGAENRITKAAIMYKGEDVTDQFESGVTAENGTLSITARPVVLQSASDSKVYDGKPLTNSKVTFQDGKTFVEGEVKAEAVGSITKVGDTKNTIKLTVADGYTLDNYDIQKTEGTLTVTPNSEAVTVTARSASKPYDGTALTAGYDWTAPSGYTVEAETNGSVTDVGKSVNKIESYVVRDADGNDVTDQFDNIKTSDGTLEVTKRQVILSSGSDSREYDGTALTKPGVTIGGQGFVSGEVSNIRATGSITKVGKTENTIEYDTNDGFKAGNYQITENPGTLEITANTTAAIKVTAPSDTKVYDGKTLKAGAATVTGLPDGFTGTADSKGSIKDAGTVATTVDESTLVIRDADGNDVTDQFSNITYKNGELKVTKRNVTLKSESATRAYNGSALTRLDVEVGGQGFVDGEVKDIKATGSITKVGTVKNLITFAAGDNFNKENYNIKNDEGDLTITQVPVSTADVAVTANSNSWVYDGKSHSDDGYTTSGLDKMPSGFSVKATVVGSVKNVNDSGAENKITKAAIMYKGEDVTDQFESGVAIKNGVLNITKKPVVIRSASDSKVYDGKPLTNSKVYFQDGKTFVEGEVKAEGVGSITKAGSIENPIKYTVNDGYTLDNYDIEQSFGTLTVTKNSEAVTVTARSANKPYDGTALTAGYDWTAPAGYTVEAKTSGSITDVGKTANRIDSYVVRDADGNDVTDQFDNIKTTDGTLEVTKRQVVLTSGSAVKEYDGKALTNSEVTGGDQFVAGEVSNIRATGSITGVGKVKNTIKYDTNDGFKAGNYQITENPGTLEITANTSAKIKVTAASGSKKYDGTPLTAGAATVTGLPAGFTGAADSTGSIKDVGTLKTAVDKNSLVISDGDGKDVTAYFASIEYAAGELRIDPRSVILTSGSATKPYDRTPLTNSDMTVGGDGFAAGEGASYTFTGSQTEQGESDNTFDYILNDGTKSNNYSIEVNYGKLTVTAPILYTATIHYTDANGNTLAPDYIGQYMVGDSFSITSPAVSGYTPREAYVTMASMPERNVEVTVVYDRNPDVTPVTPVVPPVTPPVRPGFNPGTGITTGGAAIVAGPSGDTLTDLGDVKTPKANRTLHEKCNILPFLFMLLTMFVVIAYTHSMKKDQEEIFELTEDLEEKKRL